MAGTRAVHRDADDDQGDACQVTYGRDLAPVQKRSSRQIRGVIAALSWTATMNPMLR
jgi:hypothetical protein